jgi:glycosyltransferase involved in cell wall biosynthesis
MSKKRAATDKKRKLLVFHQSLAPYRIDFWNYLHEKYDLKLYFLNKNHLDQHFDQKSLRSSLNFKCYYLSSGIKIGPRVVRWGFLSIILRFNPDVIFTYEYSQTTTSIHLIKKILRLKYKHYSICDDSLQIAKTCEGVRKYFRDALVEKLDGLVVANLDVAEWYGSQFRLKNNCIVFPIIVREDYFRNQLSTAIPETNKLIHSHKLSGKKCILFVGRLVAVKGIDRLLKSFENIHDQFPEAVIIIIGEGEEKKNLKELCARLGIQNKVLFLGRLERPQLYWWYNIGQIFVLPSHYEPFGAVVNEALVSGSNVICSSYAGSSFLIKSPFNGDTFEPFDIDKLAHLLRYELKRSTSLQLLETPRPSKMLFNFDNFTNNISV